MRRAIFIMVKVLALLALAGIFKVSNSPFYMVGGSDSTSFLIKPSLIVQVVAFALCAIAMFAQVSRIKGRLVMMLIAIVAAFVGGHRLLVDNNHNQVKDIYLAVTLHSVSIDGSSEAPLLLKYTLAGFKIGQAGASKSLWIFSPPLVGLDRAPLAAIPHI